MTSGMCRIVRWLLLAAVTLLGAGCGVDAADDNGGLHGRQVPASYFGMHVHRVGATGGEYPPTPWPGRKFGTWRLWDADVAWFHLEPAKGKWDFGRLDRYVDLARQDGIEIVMPLGLSPTWASARPQEHSPYQMGAAAEPRDMEDWRAYVRTVGERYKGRIHIYEVWNEVNEEMFFTGSMEALVALTREAASVLKKIDPEIRIVSPSMVGAGRSLEWLDRFFAAGGGDHVDVVGYHFYVPNDRPEAMLPMIRDARARMRRHGQGQKPLWNTETGWWIENLDGTPDPPGMDRSWRRVDQQTAAAYLVRSMLVGLAGGLEGFHWYSWDNGGMGMVEPKSKKERPAVGALQRTMAWLSGTRMLGCETGGRVWSCGFEDAQGRPVKAVWVPSGAREAYQVPEGWQNVDAILADGASAKPGSAAGVWDVGAMPLFLRGAVGLRAAGVPQ